MYKQVEKPKENTSPAGRQESRALANVVAQQKRGGKQGFGFVDNRPEVIAQRKVQEIPNNSSQVKQLDQLQAKGGNYSTRKHPSGVRLINSICQLVKIKGETLPVNEHNEGILKDALDALHEMQNGMNGFLAWCKSLIVKTKSDGVVAHKAEVKEFYSSTKEVWFSVNPILKEAWSRCIAATRSVANKSKYHKVGGKFKRKLEEVLQEIGVSFKGLSIKTNSLVTAYINKEHIENKGLGGDQTAHDNLMNAGVGPKGMGIGKGTLSYFHKTLHALKAQGSNLFNSMNKGIRSIIQSVKSNSDGNEMGEFDWEEK